MLQKLFSFFASSLKVSEKERSMSQSSEQDQNSSLQQSQEEGLELRSCYELHFSSYMIYSYIFGFIYWVVGRFTGFSFFFQAFFSFGGTNFGGTNSFFFIYQEHIYSLVWEGGLLGFLRIGAFTTLFFFYFSYFTWLVYFLSQVFLPVITAAVLTSSFLSPYSCVKDVLFFTNALLTGFGKGAYFSLVGYCLGLTIWLIGLLLGTFGKGTTILSGFQCASMREGFICIRSAKSLGESSFFLPDAGRLKKLFGPFLTTICGVLAFAFVGDSTCSLSSYLDMMTSLLFSPFSRAIKLGGGFNAKPWAVLLLSCSRWEAVMNLLILVATMGDRKI